MIGLISTIANVATSATTGAMSIYGALETKELAEEQFELQEELARRKASLEEALYGAQLNMIGVQTEGLSASQGIQLSLSQAEAELRQAQIEREKRLLEAREEIDALSLQKEMEALKKASEISATSQIQAATIKSGTKWIWYIGGAGASAALLYFTLRSRK